MDKCSYCNGKGKFKNTSLTHKYRHEGCKKYSKKCTMCGTIYSEEDKTSNPQVQVVENIFEVDKCKCGHWLPDFPTSWTRSFTNLGKINEVINDINENEQIEIDSENLFKIQRSHSGVVFNLTRANIRGYEEYKAGASVRRMSEYISSLTHMGILYIKKFGRYNKKYHSLTKFGEEIGNKENIKELLALYIIAFLNIKVNNGYFKNQKNNFYNLFRNRFAHNILKMVNYLEEEGIEPDLYNISLSILARNDDQFNKEAKYFAKSYSSSHLKDIFFKNDDEANRAVKQTLLSVLESLKIIDSKEGIYSLTALGSQILDFLNQSPPIWFEDIHEFEPDRKLELFAKLLVWRLVNNNIIEKKQLDLNFEDIENAITQITGKDIEDIKDIHLNLYYDEPFNKKSHITDYHSGIKSHIRDYFKRGVTNEEIQELTQSLHYTWFDEILSIVEDNLKNEEDLVAIEDLFSETLQSGREWHEESKQLLAECGFKVKDYAEDRLFEKLIIPGLSISLPGGTIHNPDLLIYEKGFGPKGVILVDAKSENSINSELHKLAGYNEYSYHEEVDTYTLILLEGTLPRSTQIRVDKNKDSFNRVSILEKEALTILANKGLSKNEILEKVLPRDEFKHITPKDIK